MVNEQGLIAEYGNTLQSNNCVFPVVALIYES